jgi:copper chaperone NosL
MTSRARWMVLIASLVMATAYVLPLWRVDLIAPQYPEGLGMYITISGVDGLKPNDLNSINNLNHYIGMKAIVPESIPELRYMPWILAALIAGGLAVAATGKRLALHVWGGALALLLVAGLADFYRWGYDYGHDLDEEMAIIKVPGMSYQPPLIGSKKLLNFRATSWPSGGGIALGLAAGLVFLAVLDTRKRALLGAVMLAAAGCAGVSPRDLVVNEDACELCKMQISDPRFGSQVVTTTGRQLVFDSPECLAEFLDRTPAEKVATVWVLDVEHPGTWVEASQAGFLIDASLRSPMGRITAFASPAAAEAARERLGGQPLSWEAVRSGAGEAHAMPATMADAPQHDHAAHGGH